MVSKDIKVETRSERIDTAKTKLKGYLQGFNNEDIKKETLRHFDAYWLVLDTPTQKLIAEMIIRLEQDPLQVEPAYDNERDITKIIFVMEDHPGIFSRLSGALALVGANVVDARSYTSKDGFATAAFWVQDSDGAPYEQSRFSRLRGMIEKTLSGEIITRDAIKKRDKFKKRERAFHI